MKYHSNHILMTIKVKNSLESVIGLYCSSWVHNVDWLRILNYFIDNRSTIIRQCLYERNKKKEINTRYTVPPHSKRLIMGHDLLYSNWITAPNEFHLPLLSVVSPRHKYADICIIHRFISRDMKCHEKH
jgi:hypothetical protein